MTGSAFTSTQRMYYTLSDGPPGCFQWGFGKGVGCLHEHGDFVKARLPNGYGPAEAALTTLRRLRHHLSDGFNLEPLALVVLLALRRRTPSVVATASVVGLQFLAYAPFYFDGDYPGGGARFFADILPLEHALAVVAIGGLTQRSLRRGIYALVALALVGFGVHAVFDHLKLRDRDGGRPMFESDLLTKANVTKGLVFVDTDHAFGIGHDPHARVKDGIVVARLRSDDRDRLLYEALEKPLAYLYKFEAPADGTKANPTVVPWIPPDLGDPMRFEAEAEWPAVSQTNGFAIPGWVHTCASGTKALILTPVDKEVTATATITIPVREKAKYTVVVRIVRNAKLPFVPEIPDASTRSTSSAKIGSATFVWSEMGPPCYDLPAQTVELEPPHALLTIEAKHGVSAIDNVTLKKLP